MRRAAAIFGAILTLAVIAELVLVPIQLSKNSDDQARAACQAIVSQRAAIIRQAADQANGLIDFAIRVARTPAAAKRTRAFRDDYVDYQIALAKRHNPKPSCSRIVAGKAPIKKGSK